MWCVATHTHTLTEQVMRAVAVTYLGHITRLLTLPLFLLLLSRIWEWNEGKEGLKAAVPYWIHKSAPGWRLHCFILNGSLPPLYKSQHVAPHAVLLDSKEEREIKDFIALLSFVPSFLSQETVKQATFTEPHPGGPPHSQCKKPSAQAGGGGLYC